MQSGVIREPRASELAPLLGELYARINIPDIENTSKNAYDSLEEVIHSFVRANWLHNYCHPDVILAIASDKQERKKIRPTLTNRWAKPSQGAYTAEEEPASAPPELPGNDVSATMRYFMLVSPG